MKGSGSEMNSLSFRSSEGDQDESLERLARAFWESHEPEKLPWQTLNPVGIIPDAVGTQGVQSDA